MATLDEVLQQFVSWGTGWKNSSLSKDATIATLQQALTDAQTAQQASADALKQFQDDDAATDAAQISAAQAEQQATDAQAAADAAQAVLDQVNAADAPPPPPEDPPVVTPPADGGDTGGDVGTVDPGDGSTPPSDGSTPPDTTPPADGGDTGTVTPPPDGGDVTGLPGAGTVVGDVSETGPVVDNPLGEPVDGSGTGQ